MPDAKTKSKRRRRTPPAKRTALELLSTGVPGLDEILDGGLPAYSLNLVAGDPGTGKSTLAMQFLFANATPARPGLYITLLGESSLKMMRYQQQLGFFDLDRVGVDVHFLNLTTTALSGSLESVLKQIVAEVERLNPGVVVVDSFRSLVRSQRSEGATEIALETFVQRLAQHLTTWEVTAFMIGEYTESEMRSPIFTVADGILWLTQATDRNSVVRKLQVVKMRGTATMPGLHTMRMTSDGVQVFPRTPERAADRDVRGHKRLSIGIAGLDEMMHGGIPAGDSLILAGQTGTGKTTFAMQFAVAGLRAGEAAVIAIFEEHPDVYLARAKSFGVDLDAAMRDDKLRIIYLRPLDLSVDETLDEIRRAVHEIDATRVVIDSISGFEMALAPTFRTDFRESLYRLIGALTGMGVTIFSTVEVPEGHAGLQLTGYQVSFLTDDIISQRYVEIEGELRKALVIVKMRGSNHSREFRRYEMTASGVLLREALHGYDGITGGMPTRELRMPEPAYPGLVETEVLVLETVTRSGGLSAPDIVGMTGLAKGGATGVDAILRRLEQLAFVKHVGAVYEAVVPQHGH